jgi:hypothetical protein
MAKLPGRRASRLIRRARPLLLAAALALPAASAGAEVALEGTWHVLVHYRDDGAHDPTQQRWEDRIWVFEPRGSRLEWSEYPIVVFKDRSGRFEALGTNRASRIAHAWEPNQEQLAQIQSGLEINSRGKKSKTLRHGARGWRSSDSARAASASVITYMETWIIEGSAELPIFRREDVMGSATSETLEGITEYAVEVAEPGGQVLRGTYERDGTRHGSFRMMRAGEVRGVSGSGKSQGQRLMNAWFGDLGDAVGGDEGALRAEVERRIRNGEEVPEPVREELRAEIQREIELRNDRRGSPALSSEEVVELAREIERQIVEEGRSLEEVGQMLERGTLR